MPRQFRHPRARLVDFDKVNGAALAQPHRLLAELLPDGVIRGNEYIVRNPRRHDKRPGSFSINLRNGRWADFAIDASGNDLVSLVAYLLNVRQYQAAEVVAHIVGVDRRRPR
jgi:hypothetical protein